MSQRQPTPEEIAAMQAEIDRIGVDEVLLQTVVDVLNFTARKAGLATPPGEEAPAPAWPQVRLGIDACRALVGLLEPLHADKLPPIRNALSQLQMAYARAVQSGQAAPAADTEGAAAGGEEAAAQSGAGAAQEQAPPPPKPGQPGPAQQSGRLWIPGQ